MTLFVALVALLSTLSAAMAILVDPRTGEYPSLGPPVEDNLEDALPTPPAVWGLHRASVGILIASSALSIALPYFSADSAVVSAAMLCLLDPLWLGLHLSFLHHRSHTTCWQRHPINITFVHDETAIMLPDGQVIELSDHRLQGGPLVGRGPMLWALLHLERRFDPLERACVALEAALAAFAVCAIVHLCTFALIYEARAQTSDVDSVLRRLPIVKYAAAAARARALGYSFGTESGAGGGLPTTDRLVANGDLNGAAYPPAPFSAPNSHGEHSSTRDEAGCWRMGDAGRRDSVKSDASDGDACAICLSGYGPTDEVRVLPCRHYLHRRCLDKWVEHKKRVSCCALASRPRLPQPCPPPLSTTAAGPY